MYITDFSVVVCFDEIRRLTYFALKIFRDFFPFLLFRPLLAILKSGKELFSFSLWI